MRKILFILLAMVVIAGFALVPVAFAQDTDPGSNPPAPTAPDEGENPDPAPPAETPAAPEAPADFLMTPELKEKLKVLNARIAALATQLVNLKTAMKEAFEQAVEHKAENARAVEEHYSNVGNQIQPLLEAHYARDDISMDEKNALASDALAAFQQKLAGLK